MSFFVPTEWNEWSFFSLISFQLTSECVCALTRIFRICDVDNDGYLSDKELEAFQERCFAIPLTAQSLFDVKQLIRNSTPGGVTVTGVTLKGALVAVASMWCSDLHRPNVSHNDDFYHFAFGSRVFLHILCISF